MIPVSSYDGNIEDYSGICRILVTDSLNSEKEYYSLKSKMLAKGIELVSTSHRDTDAVSQLILDSLVRRKKYGGRHKFGFQSMNGETKLTERGRAIVKRIFELRDQGCTYDTIRKDVGVFHMDGGEISVSTIQIILRNRKFYEKEGL
jgi:hypothetical protein